MSYLLGDDMANDPELRGPCPRETLDIIDAVSMARGLSRMELVNSVLAKYCVDVVREANMVYRVARGNPALRDASGKLQE